MSTSTEDEIREVIDPESMKHHLVQTILQVVSISTALSLVNILKQGDSFC
jgi:hypothetical protein